MEVFLPIAEVSVNIITIFSLSTIVGILSGLFGVGGGFLMTPFLIFLGVPPAYAVANEANNILATSVSGSTTHWLKNTLDYKMGIMIYNLMYFLTNVLLSQRQTLLIYCWLHLLQHMLEVYPKKLKKES